MIKRSLGPGRGLGPAPKSCGEVLRCPMDLGVQSYVCWVSLVASPLLHSDQEEWDWHSRETDRLECVSENIRCRSMDAVSVSAADFAHFKTTEFPEVKVSSHGFVSELYTGNVVMDGAACKELSVEVITQAFYTATRKARKR
eukprot:5113781-Amphidinium_carterae.1